MSSREPSEFRLEFHTDDPAMRELAECYWASRCEPDGRIAFTYRVVEDLASRFGLRRTAAAVTGPAMAAATAFYGQCPRCGQELKFPHRTAFQQEYARYGRAKPCDTCREEEQQQQEEKRQAVIAARRLAIERAYQDDPAEINVWAMTLKDAVFSLAVLRASGIADTRSLGGVFSFVTRLSPDRDFDREILKHLCERGVLVIDPASDVEAFEFNAQGVPDRYFPLRVCWLLRDPHPSDFASRLEALLSQGEYPASWSLDLGDATSRIAEYECKEFIDLVWRANFLNFELPSDWRQVISGALEICPVSQLQPLLLQAVRETYQRKSVSGLTPEEQGCAILERLHVLTDRVLAGHETPESTPRYRECPRSAISFAVYDVLLRAVDEGFTRLPDSFRLQEEDCDFPDGSDDLSPFLNEEIIRHAIELSKREQEDSDAGTAPCGEHVASSPLLVYLAGLSAADRAQVAAVMLIGRGDEREADFAEVVRGWTQPLEWTQAEYLAGKRVLWKFLEVGLEKLSAFGS